MIEIVCTVVGLLILCLVISTVLSPEWDAQTPAEKRTIKIGCVMLMAFAILVTGVYLIGGLPWAMVVVGACGIAHCVRIF